MVKNEIKELCTKYNKTFSALGQAVGVHSTTVGKWNERGLPAKYREKTMKFFGIEGEASTSVEISTAESEIRSLCVKHNKTYRQVAEGLNIPYGSVACWRKIPSKHKEKVMNFFGAVEKEVVSPGVKSEPVEIEAVPKQTRSYTRQVPELKDFLKEEEKPYVIIISKDLSILDNIMNLL